LQAAVAEDGAILTPDWLAGTAVRDGTLVQILRQWRRAEDGGINVVMPPVVTAANQAARAFATLILYLKVSV
jgi:hypothetical protein